MTIRKLTIPVELESWQVDEIMEKELRNVLELELSSGAEWAFDEELVQALAIVLKYYTAPDKHSEIDAFISSKLESIQEEVK